MKKYVKIIVIAFLSGMFTLGLVQAGLEVTINRQGTFGGEVLILPLIAVILAFGYDIGKTYWKEKEAKMIAKRSFAKGYSVGACLTLEKLSPKAK